MRHNRPYTLLLALCMAAGAYAQDNGGTQKYSNDGRHKGVRLSPKEKEILYTWMDLNGVYYPVYESAFDNTMAGRCPLTNDEVNELSQLTGINLWSLNNWRRPLPAQIAFNRPEKSPILDAVKQDKDKYKNLIL